MAQNQCVILYGDSLILAGVQASLSAFPDVELITLEELPADWVAILHELRPCAILFDLCSTWPDLPLAMLRQSNLVLIGIGPDSARTLVLSSHPTLTSSAEDLVNLIGHRNAMPDGGKGG